MGSKQSKLITIVFILIVLLLVNTQGSSSRLTSFQLTPQQHLLVLYAHYQDGDQLGEQIQKYTKVNFKIDFSSSEIIIDKQHANRQLFFDRSLRHSMKDLVKIGNKSIPKQIRSHGKNQEQQVHGIIGFKPNSQFFQAIKHTLKIEHFKLWVRMYENIIQIIQSDCNNPIFPPFQIQIETSTKSQFISINDLSFQFLPISHKFLNLIDKQSNPFTITPGELKSKINLQLLNQVQTIPLRTLIIHKCMLISRSQNFQCDLEQNLHKDRNKIDDFGLLIFQFDPIICVDRSAIQLMREGYYWGHIVLILVQIALIFVFKYRHNIQRRIDCFIKGEKHH